jgi:CHAT domain-containing protein/tetratricopeptide (TPR) repeat protein
VIALVVVVPLLLQSPNGAESVRLLARSGADSTLLEHVRRQPDDAREALRQLIVEASRGASLVDAERLASAFAAAWNDSFHVRQVARFRALSPEQRRAKVAADSVRRAGNDALGTAGINAAMRAWRESVRRFDALDDSAGVAAGLGNLGAGFYRAQTLDSADAYLVRSRDLANAIGDYRTLANAIGTLGSVRKDRGDLRSAAELYARASEIRSRSGDLRGLAADQNNLGLIAEELGDLAAARRAYEAALAANRTAGRALPAATNLENLGNIAALEGEYAVAAAHYREALATYRAHGNVVEAASVIHNLGLLAMRRGDYPGAITYLIEAAGVYRRAAQAADEIAVRRDLANARAAAGDLQGARADLQRAETLAGVDKNAGVVLAQADLALQFNRLSEAERRYERAVQLARRVGDEETRAAAQQGLGLVLLVRETYPRAITTLERSLQAQEVLGDRRAAALTRLLIGYGWRESGDPAMARRVLLQALDTLHRLGDAAGEAAALGALAEVEVRAGLPLTAESLYHRAIARLGARPAPEIAWQLHAGLAAALRTRGALDEAVSHLLAAISEIERVAAGLTVEERRAAFFADKWEAYVDLALIERARGNSAKAFAASERLRARQMLDLLARGRVAEDSNDREPTGREQDLRRRITELTRQIENEGDDEAGLRGPALQTAAAAREALAQAQDEYGQVLLELREANPSYAALVRGEIAPVTDVRAALASDEALLEYLVGDSTSVVFIVTRDSVATLDLNVSRATLASLVDFVRGTLAKPADSATRAAWRAPMRRLFQHLFAPVQATGVLAGKTRLLIAPHAELHYVPFAALLEPGPRGQPLIERYVVAYVPSASVWLRLRARSTSKDASGVLALAPHVRALPGSRDEVAAIARILGDRTRVLAGSQASERAFRTLAPEHDVVHLATYGVLNKHNPLFSFVELGAGGGEDGRLEVHEVFGLSLRARLLVLSACQTGVAAGALTDVPPGDDWVGLVQGFLFAGASNVVATLWPVEDLATARFMESFYRELAAGRTEADALAQAQRTAARDTRRAHPFFWAGFSVVRGS